jgi:acylphosphatase
MSTQGRLRVQAIITGRVQGVAFRWYTRETAVGLGVTGWVRNLPDGSVELTAEGNREQLEDLLAWCRQGPSMASVDDMRTEWSDATGEFPSFSIRH